MSSRFNDSQLPSLSSQEFGISLAPAILARRQKISKIKTYMRACHCLFIMVQDFRASLMIRSARYVLRFHSYHTRPAFAVRMLRAAAGGIGPKPHIPRGKNHRSCPHFSSWLSRVDFCVVLFSVIPKVVHIFWPFITYNSELEMVFAKKKKL